MKHCSDFFVLNSTDDKHYVGLINPDNEHCSSANACANKFEWDPSTGTTGTLGDNSMYKDFNDFSGDGKDAIVLDTDFKGFDDDFSSDHYFICMCDPSGEDKSCHAVFLFRILP